MGASALVEPIRGGGWMQGKHLMADASDDAAVKSISRELTGWDPLLSLKITRGDSLYGGILVSYGLNIGGEARLAFRDRTETMASGAAVVIPPSVRVAATPRAEMLWLCYEGLAPEHLRGPLATTVGFELLETPARTSDPSPHNSAHQPNPPGDLRFRTLCSILTDTIDPFRVPTGAVDILFVLHGHGSIRIESADRSPTELPLPTGGLIVIGPGLAYRTSGEARARVWTWPKEMEYRRRVRDAGS